MTAHAMRPAAPLPPARRLLAATAAVLLALLVAASCEDPDRVMNDPNDRLGQHLRDWRDDQRDGR